MAVAVTAVTSDSPPDWSTQATELLCPLCEYNLRGLTESRCPECGFAFTWQELLEAEKNQHPYLFEHGIGGNQRTFWKTFWNTCRPRKFWRELNPAQPVVLRRLLIYWIITCCLVIALLFGSKAVDMIKTAQTNQAMRESYAHRGNHQVQAHIEDYYPSPGQAAFWRQIWRHESSTDLVGIGWGIIFLGWPWLTLITLTIFRFSMKKAKIRTVHLLRAILYSTDFAFLLATAFAVLCAIDPSLGSGFLGVEGALICCIVTTYRLTISFSRYLRVHLSFATALATQLISLLAVFTALTWIADFSFRL